MEHVPPRAPDHLTEHDVRRMTAEIPADVAWVVTTLENAGHRAVVVGGAIRDMVLGLHPDDFDVATSATPDEVAATFTHTIPTGVEHGTITVVPPGRDATHVEVTTFRTEEGYSDGRRPDRVTFVREVEADLSRRDFTINAMALALHPAPLVIDPFRGLLDLHAGTLRTVGEADRRFEEDGLRAMRAARLAAQLSLAATPGLEPAMQRALPIIMGVAVERVQVELHKLLVRAVRPSVGLTMMQRTGLMALCAGAPTDNASLLRPDRVPARVEGADEARWAAWLWNAGAAEANALLTRLRCSRAFTQDVSALCALPLPRQVLATEDASVRAMVRALQRARLPAARLLWRSEDGGADACARVDSVITAGLVESPSGLAINGHDLQALGARGAVIGRAQQALLRHVDAHPADNTRDALLERARMFITSPA